MHSLLEKKITCIHPATPPPPGSSQIRDFEAPFLLQSREKSFYILCQPIKVWFTTSTATIPSLCTYCTFRAEYIVIAHVIAGSPMSAMSRPEKKQRKSCWEREKVVIVIRYNVTHYPYMRKKYGDHHHQQHKNYGKIFISEKLNRWVWLCWKNCKEESN